MYNTRNSVQCSGTTENRDGMGWGVGGRFKREGTYVYLWLIHIVWQKPTSKEQRLRSCRRAERSYSTFQVRRGGHVEIPLIQGKEQRLRFAGAAVKRDPTSNVRETQVRQ